MTPADITIRGAVSEWTEAEFQRHVVKLAVDRGWGVPRRETRDFDEFLVRHGQAPAPLDGLIFHPRIMYRSEPGWPDLTLIRRRDRRVIFAELKTDKKTSKVTPRQSAVLMLLCDVFGVNILGADRTFYGADRLPTLRVAVAVWRPRDLAQITEVLA